MELRKEAVVGRTIVNSDEIKVDKLQIAKTVYIWAMVVFGIVGFFVGFNLYAPLNSIQVTNCEMVAKEIYDSKDKGMIRIPQGYSVQRTETEISVSQVNHVGCVTATIQDNELVFHHNKGVGTQILQGVGFTIIGVLVVNLMTSIIAGFVESTKGRYLK